MMRSMYSAVSGLKTHQTKMDVIGNNIANVNTVAFKSSSVTFQDILYQTTSGASGANNLTGVGGVNAKQIGLGVTTGATNLSITSTGAAETTGNPFDIRLTDQSTTNFFVVNNGSENLFTRSGSFYVDGAGNLCMSSTGYTVMGWQVDPATGNIRKDTVSALRVMQAANLTSPPEATTLGTCKGIIDKNDTDVKSDQGLIKNFAFYDKLGYEYTARFSIKSTSVEGEFSVSLDSILDSEGNNIIAGMSDADKAKLFGNLTPNATLGKYTDVKTGFYKDAATGKIYEGTGNTGIELQFDPATNTFKPAAAQGPFDTINSGFFYDTTANKFYVGNDATGTEIQYNAATQKFEEVGGGTGTYSAADVYNLSTSVADLLNNGGTAAVDGTGKLTINTAALTNVADHTHSLKKVYGISDGMVGKLAAGATSAVDASGNLIITGPTVDHTLKFSTADGTFVSINGMDSVGLNLSTSGLFNNGNFDDISIDFSGTQNTNNGEKSTVGMTSGDEEENGKGKKLGAMTGLSVDNNGKIYGTYDNGNETLLGQIAVAQFANASGLEKVGDNCYTTTLNSGEFDGIGVEIAADGSKMTSGELEMSNVDLSTEFTQMIVTQRGFQANSRVITTSDTLLEELVNLKR